MPGPSLLPDRILVAAAIVLTATLFTREALDPVNVVKLTALLFVATALIALAVARVVRYRIARIPVSAASGTALLLGTGFILSAATAPMLSTATVGTYGRNSGLLAYLAALALFLTGLRVFDAGRARVLLGGLVAAGLFTASYGLLQKAGLDAIPWNNPFNPIIAALGNPNFASGYLGIAASVATGAAFYSKWHGGWRVASGVTAVMALAAAGLSASVQGPIAAAGGLLVVATAFALNCRSTLRTGILSALAAISMIGLGTLLTGAIKKEGPAAALFSDVGSEARTYYWGGALKMFREQPVLGVGLDHYGAFWRSTRSPASVEALGGGQFSDAAHSVPLQMLAQGGLVLGFAYAAFVLVVLAALVKGLLRLRGPERMLLGALGGGWMAYQVQSAVSIDQVPLIVLHFTLAGGVVAVAGASGLREVRLPGAPQPAPVSPSDGRTKRRLAAAASPRQRAMTGADLAMLSLVGLAALAMLWQGLTPLRANMAALDGDRALNRGDGTAAVAAYDNAAALLPGEAIYWAKKGEFFRRLDPPQLPQAQAAFAEAVRRDPYNAIIAKTAASTAEQSRDLDLSRTLFRRAVEVDPLNPETVVAAATFELRHSGAVAARALLERAADQVPSSAAVWAALGDARLVLDDVSAAEEAYDRALRLDPMQETALAGLAKLRTR